MEKITELKCVLCGRSYPEDKVPYVCPHCGIEGLLDVYYDYAGIAARFNRSTLAHNPDKSIWRYAPILPIDEDPATFIPLAIGWTPLYKSRRLNAHLGLSNLYIKDDGRNPSASFKDRASSVGIMRAKAAGEQLITAASTGNAASSLSCLCAAIGMDTIIFVPQTAPKAKIAQLLIFGSKVVMVKGNYDQAFDLCLQATETWGWYNRNTGFNPYLLEGKKTAALEICEQLNWEVPDKVAVSVGDGCIIGGLWKGFYDFKALGLIDRIPQLICVQAEGSNAITTAFNRQQPITPVDAQTIADSISVCNPRAANQALRGLRESRGMAVTVSDDDILAAMRILARQAGVFGEPAGVTSLAGIIKLQAQGKIAADDKVVALITGNGLKDIEGALKATQAEPILVEPDIAAVKTALNL